MPVQACMRIMGFSSMKRPTMNGGAIPPEPEKTVETDIILFVSGMNSTCRKSEGTREGGGGEKKRRPSAPELRRYQLEIN